MELSDIQMYRITKKLTYPILNNIGYSMMYCRCLFVIVLICPVYCCCAVAC